MEQGAADPGPTGSGLRLGSRQVWIQRAKSEVQTVDHTTMDLERALSVANVHGPYVLVGHSSGSYETIFFKDRHPSDVVGMVLIDPAYPDQAAISARNTPLLAAATKAWDEGGFALSMRCAALLKSGVLKVGTPDPDGCLSIPPEYPDSLRQRSLRLYTNPEMFVTAASLFATFATSGHLVVKRDRSFGAMPLRVLTADTLLAAPGASPALEAEMPAVRKEWQSQHDRLAALSTNGTNVRVRDTQHDIQHMQPQAVIEAIEDVITQIRKSR